MAKTQSAALATTDYAGMYGALVQTGGKEMLDIVRENLGSSRIQVFDLERIKIPAGAGTHWNLVDSDTGEDSPEKFVEGVVIAQVQSRAYWSEKFSGSGKPPECVSTDGRTGNGDPGDGKGARTGMSCDMCPNAQFGSAAEQHGDPGNSQACKATRFIFLLREGKALPSLLGVTPGSLKDFNKFLMQMVSSMKPLSHYVLRFELEKAQSGTGIAFSKVKTSIASKLDENQIKAISSYAQNFMPMIQAMDMSKEVENFNAHED